MDDENGTDVKAIASLIELYEMFMFPIEKPEEPTP